jgi:hypothetical protein
MRISSLSFWLTSVSIASSTLAFSTLSKKQHFVNNNNNNNIGQQHQFQHQSAVLSSTRRQGKTKNTQLGVASAENTSILSVADMERGLEGRIEAAFEAAKVKDEAAFVTFITAGYPTAQGTCISVYSLRSTYRH